MSRSYFEALKNEKNALFQSLYKDGDGIQPLEVSYLKDGAQTQIMLWPGAEISYSVNGIIKETSIQLIPKYNMLNTLKSTILKINSSLYNELK